MMSDSMRAPSLASDRAVSGWTDATTLAAELNTRRRSCGSGCGRATADLTTLSTKSFLACCFCVAAVAGLTAGGFAVDGFDCANEGDIREKMASASRIICFIE